MTTQALNPKLPTELFDEKTFYTLSGATGAVFITALVVQIIFPHLPLRTFHLIVLVLSELIAVVIMLQNKNGKSIKYLFTFLNGLLIFINVNGVNQILSYYSNKSETQATANYKASPNMQLNNQYTGNQQAGIFRFPIIKNWWPDEKLSNQNQELTKKIAKLNSENTQLRSFLGAKPDKENLRLIEKVDSLSGVNNSLKFQLKEKQNQLDEYKNNNRDLGRTSQQLQDFIRKANAKSDSLDLCLMNNNRLEGSNRKLNLALENCEKDKNSLKNQLDNCKIQEERLIQRINSFKEQIENQRPGNTNLSLTEHIKQTCNRDTRIQDLRTLNRMKTPDDNLMEQDFWKSFCANFNRWILTQR